MKGILLPASLVLVTAIGLDTAAQQPANRTGAGQQAGLSPEMWYYQQQVERYDDPKQAIRRNAEFQAQQRMARLEAMRWYGYSVARPTASPTPFTSKSSAGWYANFHRPYAWHMASRPTVVVTGHGFGQ
jgi:hypothetical protein